MRRVLTLPAAVRDDEVNLVLRDLAPSIRGMARSYPRAEYDDLVSVGMTAAWLTLTRRGITERGMLLTKARWAMQDHLRVVNPQKRTRMRKPGRAEVVILSLDELAENGFEMEGGITRPDVDGAAPALRSALQRALKALPATMRFAVEQRLAGAKLDPIAARLGVTQPRVSQVLAEATQRLQVALLRRRRR